MGICKNSRGIRAEYFNFDWPYINKDKYDQNIAANKIGKKYGKNIYDIREWICYYLIYFIMEDRIFSMKLESI